MNKYKLVWESHISDFVDLYGCDERSLGSYMFCNVRG